MTLTTKDLSHKAMLVDLTITQWTAKKYDKKANDAVEEKFATDKKAGRYRKSLDPEKFLAPIKAVISAARDFHDTNTRPWITKGPNILPSKNYMFYRDQMSKFHNQFEEVVKNTDFNTLKESAKLTLGGLFNEEDYPDESIIRSRYSFKVNVLPIPTANDFRVTQITDEDIQAIQKQIQDQLEEANKMLMHDLWDRLYSVVSKAFEAFNDPNARFHDSKIDNIQETIDILRRLNIDDDQKLERMCKLAEEKLCNVDATEVRKVPETRKEAAIDAKKLLDAMSGYCS